MIAAIDLDGTLLCDDGSITDDVLEYIEHKWHGDLVFITGRSYNDVMKVVGIFKSRLKNFFIIYEDGQYIIRYEDGEIIVLNEAPYLSSTVVQKLDTWAKNNTLSFYLYTDNDWIFVNHHINYLKYFLTMMYSKIRKMTLRLHRKIDIDSLRDAQIIKCAIVGNESIKEYVYELNKRINPDAYAVFNDHRIEVKNYYASKKNALLVLLQALCINDDKCVYIGNEGNDMECLCHFHFSYAVNNARKDVKKSAKKVTKECNGKGVIEALKEFSSNCETKGVM